MRSRRSRGGSRCAARSQPAWKKRFSSIPGADVWARARCNSGSRPGRSNKVWAGAYTRMRCAIRLPRTCCSRAAICARCRKCWGTPASPRRKSIRNSTSSTSQRCMTPHTRVRSGVVNGTCLRQAMDRLILRPGREKALKRRHPWIFSGAVARVEGAPMPGDTVEAWSNGGELLAVAAYSPQSQIRARVWDWRSRVIDRDFFLEQVKRALNQRSGRRPEVSDAMRLVNGEADGLPGVVADRYGDSIVLQITSAGAERWRDEIADALLDATGATRVWERSDADVRALEGLASRCGPLRGTPPPRAIVIHEHGLKFEVELE